MRLCVIGFLLFVSPTTFHAFTPLPAPRAIGLVRSDQRGQERCRGEGCMEYIIPAFAIKIFAVFGCCACGFSGRHHLVQILTVFPHETKQVITSRTSCVLPQAPLAWICSRANQLLFCEPPSILSKPVFALYRSRTWHYQASSSSHFASPRYSL